MIIKWLNEEKIMLKKQHEYDEAFYIFDEIEDKLNKPNGYKPQNSNIINTKNEMLGHESYGT